MPPFSLPTDYSRVQLVHSFQELVSTPFGNGINALCWQRSLPGDFSEIVHLIGLKDGITNLDEPLLRSLPASPAGITAIDTLLADHRLLQERGLQPTLDCIQAYPRDEEPIVVPIDVYSFHADSAPVQADTYLCTYHGAPSEGLRNDQAQPLVDHPATRRALLDIYGGQDDANFRDFLNEHCYDLHYSPTPEAQPFSFGLGNLWRIALDYPGSPVPPCIHRAPDTHPGQPSRLLLIS
jgi:hypothetical protein